MARKLKPIAEHLIVERMKYENPWWTTNAIDYDYDVMRRRLYFELFYPLVEETDIRRAVVLMGPRRVGKTVMMHHSIEKLMEKGVAKDKICYINIENPLYLYRGLEELFTNARTAVDSKTPDGWYVFFDEIQYLKDWEVHLKVLVDSYPYTKFIVSGSAAAALKLKSNESGAGRFTDFMLPPLTFHEYIYLKDLDALIRTKQVNWNGNEKEFLSTTNINELNSHFINYINFGGYPEVIFSEKMQLNPGRYIKNDIIDKVLLRDLPSLYGISNVQELNSFFSRLAYYSGNEVSLQSLSTNSNVNIDTLKKHITYLEAAFLIRRIQRIDDNAKHFQRDVSYKVFLTNPSLRSALFSPLLERDEMFGHMVETAIFAQWLHRDWIVPRYANWKKGEVDMVLLNPKTLKPNLAVEIKWSNKPYTDKKELKNIIYFCKKHSLPSAIVTTIDIDQVVEVEGIKIHFFPSAAYALTVGYNTIVKKAV
ncbi:MAG: ATPase superfamily-like protein [Flaviaesturariibacter sp.]|nr:ATPase superfamily-like protein [Flaviaesturariibacter sp.]